MSAKMIPVEVLYRAVHNILEFPMPKICKHLVALDLLNIIEKHGGMSIDRDLAEHICKAYDGNALDRMQELGIGQEEN